MAFSKTFERELNKLFRRRDPHLRADIDAVLIDRGYDVIPTTLDARGCGLGIDELIQRRFSCLFPRLSFNAPFQRTATDSDKDIVLLKPCNLFRRPSGFLGRYRVACRSHGSRCNRSRLRDRFNALLRCQFRTALNVTVSKALTVALPYLPMLTS
jgi:hypothetical protein